MIIFTRGTAAFCRNKSEDLIKLFRYRFLFLSVILSVNPNESKRHALKTVFFKSYFVLTVRAFDHSE